MGLASALAPRRPRRGGAAFVLSVTGAAIAVFVLSGTALAVDCDLLQPVGVCPTPTVDVPLPTPTLDDLPVDDLLNGDDDSGEPTPARTGSAQPEDSDDQGAGGTGAKSGGGGTGSGSGAGDTSEAGAPAVGSPPMLVLAAKRAAGLAKTFAIPLGLAALILVLFWAASRGPGRLEKLDEFGDGSVYKL